MVPDELVSKHNNGGNILMDNFEAKAINAWVKLNNKLGESFDLVSKDMHKVFKDVKFLNKRVNFLGISMIAALIIAYKKADNDNKAINKLKNRVKNLEKELDVCYEEGSEELFPDEKGIKI